MSRSSAWRARCSRSAATVAGFTGGSTGGHTDARPRPGNHSAPRCVQIEIVGFAAQTPTWAPEKLAFIRDVVRGIEDLVPIPHRPIAASLDASGVGATPANRMSVQEWNRFSGWWGHQHVPSETHWDPGAIDIAAILS